MHSANIGSILLDSSSALVRRRERPPEQYGLNYICNLLHFPGVTPTLRANIRVKWL
jgi:hypothetical protein